MLPDARFWRNVTIIAVAHLAIIVTVIRWDAEARRPNLQSIVWMNGGGTEVTAPDTPLSTKTAIEKAPPPEALRFEPEEKDEPTATTLANGDLRLPDVTPSPTAVALPHPKPSMAPVPNSSPKVTPKRTRKKTVMARVTPKPSSRKQGTSAEEEKNNVDKETTTKVVPANPNSVSGDKSGSVGLSGVAPPSEFSWYGRMLHDRFYHEWIQPTTSAPIGTKISALVRVRIEKDGRVSSFTIVKPSGNVVVDESIAAVAKRVTKVDPLPTDVGGVAFYEVNINFELSPKQ